MALILNLETATKVCSVSLAQNGIEICTKEIFTDHFSHAENLNVFIEDVMKMAQRKLNELDAVAVSEGPGSYTGLRIGSSSAKGLCYALDIPMIAVNSLKSLAALATNNADLICPVFDAMRMEVYAALFDAQLNEVKSTEAVIIDENSFLQFLENKRVHFVGPGALKCSEVLKHPNASFDAGLMASAKGMTKLSELKFLESDFVNVAYFEPFYLKDFIAGEKKTGL